MISAFADCNKASHAQREMEIPVLMVLAESNKNQLRLCGDFIDGLQIESYAEYP